jgi:lysyl-tRNA synthetase class 2
LSQYDSQFEQDLYQLRRDKLAQIAAIGEKLGLSHAESIYPNSFEFTHTLAKSAENIPALLPLGTDPSGEPLSAEALEAAHIEAAIAGRIMAIRVQGKAGFATLQQDGQRLQIYVRKDDVGEDLFALYKLLDLGDHIGVRGYLMRTRTGELTLKASSTHIPGHAGQPALAFLAKAMLALPDKYSGLEDTELRYRQRYLDLIVNSGAHALSSRPESAPLADEVERPAAPPAPGTQPAPSGTELETPNVREVFAKRAAILRSIRRFFDTRGYLEVETPMLHTIAGGAAARPFTTHHNALDIPLSLRIAPELYLKRLVVGGLDRVYEINRNFRNEGVSTQHNPEFTMLEFYQAYANYHDLMNLTQELITQVAQEVNGTTITNFNGTEIDLSKWTKLSMREAIVTFWDDRFGAPPSMEVFSSPKQLANFLFEAQGESSRWWKKNGTTDLPELKSPFNFRGGQFGAWHAALMNGRELGKVIAELFEELAEPHLIRPTIIYDFPLAVSPLSKVKPDEPDWVERFEFYIGGFEVGNAFSELNDPDDQRRRFEAQLLEKERGDDEAHAMDEDYVRALGYGLPPTAGEGIGIDRLTMILTGSRSIRDVILFPLMRPHKPTAPEASDPSE